MPSEYVIDIPLVEGLRRKPGPKSPQALGALVELRAGEPALSAFDFTQNPLSGVDATIAWPWPQLLRGEGQLLLGFEDSLYSVNESTYVATVVTTYNALSVAAEKAIEAGGVWALASFRDLWVATNGTSLAYSLPSNDGKVLTTDSVTLNAVCALDGRLFLGGLGGAYFAGASFAKLLNAWRAHVGDAVVTHEDMAVDTKWIMWSECAGGGYDWPFYSVLAAAGVAQAADWAKVEEALLTAIKKGEIGLAALPIHGEVLQLLPLGNAIVVLCSDAVGLLEPYEGIGYRYQVIAAVGAVGRGAGVAGDDGVVFVGSDGYLWRLSHSRALERLGYDEFVGSYDSDALASYDPAWGDYYFCDGGASVVLHNGQLSERQLMITSLVRDGAWLYGVVETAAGGWVAATGVTTPGENEAYAGFETGAFAFGQAELVELRSVELVGDGFIDMRIGASFKHSITGDWISLAAVPGSPEGIFFPRCGGIMFKLKVGLVVGVDSVVESLRVRFMYSGSRNIRGPRVTGVSLNQGITDAG